MGMLGIGYSAYVLGFIGLMFCSAIKLYPTSTFQQLYHINTSQRYVDLTNDFVNWSTQNKQSATLSAITDVIEPFNTSQSSQYNTSFHSLKLLSDVDTFNETDRVKQLDIEGNGDFTYISVIGIISFALLDIAVDSCTSLCRAFVLECSPPALHSSLLSMATAFGALASVFLSFIGTFDIPGALGRSFPVDGILATMLVLSSAIFFTITCCFACTLTTGYILTRPKYKITEQDVKIYHNGSHTDNGKCVDELRNHSTQIESEEIPQEKYNLTKPLLTISEKKIDKSYQAIGSKLSDGNKSFDANVRGSRSRVWNDDLDELNDRKAVNITFQHRNKTMANNSNAKSDHLLRPIYNSKYPYINDDVKAPGNLVRENQNQTTRTTAAPSSSTFEENTTKDCIESWKDNEGISEIHTLPNNSGHQQIWKNKRLLILCGSVFFTVGTLISYMQFGGNALTIGVYHGDPTGLLGSPGRKRYDKGVRNAALGYLLCSLSQVATSVFMNKIVNLIGDKGHYILCQVVLMIANVTWLLYQTEEMFFVTSVVMGFYRTAYFTSGYVMANKMVQDESAMVTGSTESPTKNLGKAMLLVGLMVPSTYLVISTLMGPLMSATENVFVPIMYGAVNACLALLVFCLLFIVKR